MLQRLVIPVETLFDGVATVDYKTFREKIQEHLRDLQKKSKKNYQELLDALRDWKSIPMVFDINANLFMLILALELILFAPIAYRQQPSMGNLLAVGLAFAVLVSGIVWAPFSFFRKTKYAISRLFRAAKAATIFSFFGFLLAAGNIYFFNIVFQDNPFTDGLSEVFFPWAVNLLCLSGIACITFWTVSNESSRAMKRDARCLESFPVNSPVDANITNGSQLLALLVGKIMRTEKEKAGRFYFGTFFGLLKHVFPCAVIPVQAFLLDNTALKAYKVDNYNQILKAKFTMGYLTDPFTGYVVGLALGAVSIFVSSVCFEVFLKRITYRPFRRNRMIMTHLLATTSAIPSCREEVPFLPLWDEKNIKVFYHLNTYLRQHEQGSQLGQASAGFAGVLFVDVILIAAIVVKYYLISPVDWRSLILFSYYGVIATWWCFKILMEAVAINAIHDQTLLKLAETQGEVYIQATEVDTSESLEAIYERVDHVRNSIQQTFQPVSILGIPATKTILQLLGTYVFSAVAAVVGNQVSKIRS